MKTYIINNTKKNIIKGNSTLKGENYILNFIRQEGEKTKSEDIEINEVNCTNCGAKAKITDVVKCEYCGSLLTTSKYNWLLSNIIVIYIILLF